MNDAIVQEIARKGWQAGNDTQVAFQACDDSLASTGRMGREPLPLQRPEPMRQSDVIGVIGTYNSGCAAIEIPVLNKAPGGGLAMVSPGNTYVCLTEPGSICKANEPDVYYPSGKRNYVRVVPNDAVQMAGLATFANEQGIRNPFILVAADDPTSKGQADTFEGAARSLGMNIAGVEQWDEKAKSYTDLMQKAKASGADAVLLAGLLEQNGAQIIKDKVSVLGPNDGPVKLLAPDGFAQQSTIDQAGAATKGMYASLPGKVPSSLTGEGSAFVKELKAQVGDEPLELFAPYAGQAAEVLLPAIQSGERDPLGVIASLFKTRVNDGIVGSFSITPSGDPSPGADQPLRRRTPSFSPRPSLRRRSSSTPPAASRRSALGQRGVDLPGEPPEIGTLVLRRLPLVVPVVRERPREELAVGARLPARDESAS